MVDGKYSVDIPQCPHKYINLSNLKYQNASKCTTLSTSTRARLRWRYHAASRAT